MEGGGIAACIAGGILACLAAGLGGGDLLLGKCLSGPGGLLPGEVPGLGGVPVPEGGSLQAHTQGGS